MTEDQNRQCDACHSEFSKTGLTLVIECAKHSKTKAYCEKCEPESMKKYAGWTCEDCAKESDDPHPLAAADDPKFMCVICRGEFPSEELSLICKCKDVKNNNALCKECVVSSQTKDADWNCRWCSEESVVLPSRPRNIETVFCLIDCLLKFLMFFIEIALFWIDVSLLKFMFLGYYSLVAVLVHTDNELKNVVERVTSKYVFSFAWAIGAVYGLVRSPQYIGVFSGAFVYGTVQQTVKKYSGDSWAFYSRRHVKEFKKAWRPVLVFFYLFILFNEEAAPLSLPWISVYLVLTHDLLPVQLAFFYGLFLDVARGLEPYIALIKTEPVQT